MVVDGLFSVIHAAVADFDCVRLKILFSLVVFQEVLVFYGKESVSDIGLKCLLYEGSRLFIALCNCVALHTSSCFLK